MKCGNCNADLSVKNALSYMSGDQYQAHLVPEGDGTITIYTDGFSECTSIIKCNECGAEYDGPYNEVRG